MLLLPVVVWPAHWFLFSRIYLAQVIYFIRTAAWSWVVAGSHRGQSHAVRYLIPRPWSSRCGIPLPGGRSRRRCFCFSARTRVAMRRPWRPAVGMLCYLCAAGDGVGHSRVALPDLGDDCGGNRDLFRRFAERPRLRGASERRFKPPATLLGLAMARKYANGKPDEACVCRAHPIGASSGSGKH